MYSKFKGGCKDLPSSRSITVIACENHLESMMYFPIVYIFVMISEIFFMWSTSISSLVSSSCASSSDLKLRYWNWTLFETYFFLHVIVIIRSSWRKWGTTQHNRRFFIISERQVKWLKNLLLRACIGNRRHRMHISSICIVSELEAAHCIIESRFRLVPALSPPRYRICYVCYIRSKIVF